MFFQNVFPVDYQGVWVLGDRQYSINFYCKANSGRGIDNVLSWVDGPYDLSGNDADANPKDNLTISFSQSDSDFKNWITIAFDIAGATPAATTADEIVAILNGTLQFSAYFTASIYLTETKTRRVMITQKHNSTRLKFYVLNTGAETVLKFNSRAGVSELPSYFHRHIVWSGLDNDERLSFTDGVNLLIELDPDASGGSSVVDDNIINDAVDYKGTSLGYDASAVKEDWELLQGKSGLFMFKKQTVNADNQVTESIQYHAGAKVGDLAKKIVMTYTGQQVEPDTYAEIPYTLDSGDLISP